MSLRTKLMLLLSLFGLYAVVAAAAGMLGSHVHVGRAAEEFQRIAGHTTRIEELELHLTEQTFLLGQLVESHPHAMPAYIAARRKWTETLSQCAAFTPAPAHAQTWHQLQSSAQSFESESNAVLQLMEQDRTAEARLAFQNRLMTDAIPALRSQLDAFRAAWALRQNESARSLASTTSQVLLLTIGVGLLAALLLVGGAAMIRRWLISPLAGLQSITAQLREGNLDARSRITEGDELAQLGGALNRMAEALASSESKQRTLFANMRDAVVLCDREGTIIEYHDGDTQVLGVAADQHAGRPLLEVWPDWCAALPDWPTLIRSAVDDGRKVCVHDVHLESTAVGPNGRFVDFVIYRVDCRTRRYAAVVVRDVSQRHALQDQLRHAELMKAVGTMAGGLAHDVNNLLSGVTGSLTSLVGDLPDPKHKDRIDAALRACRRAAALAKRLLDFARGIHGNPQVFSPAEVTHTILDSMDPAQLEGLALRRNLDPAVRVCADQDQFAQIVLNLLSNARDACPDGGTIDVALQVNHAADPDHPGEGDQPMALLSVADDGSGMAPDIQSRIFEPFFTTKARAGARGRGLGLTMVYAAARNAGGFVRVQSRVGMGTTIRVYLPLHGASPSARPAVATPGITEHA